VPWAATRSDSWLYRNTGPLNANVGKGIENINGGTTELAPPIIDSAGRGGVSGRTSPPCYPCTVEIFQDDEDEGRIYHGSSGTIPRAIGPIPAR